MNKNNYKIVIKSFVKILNKIFTAPIMIFNINPSSLFYASISNKKALHKMAFDWRLYS